jgi:hypothetical protein
MNRTWNLNKGKTIQDQIKKTKKNKMFIQNSKLSNTKKNSSLKSLSQLEPNFAEIMFVISPQKVLILSYLAKTWPSWAIFVSDKLCTSCFLKILQKCSCLINKYIFVSVPSQERFPPSYVMVLYLCSVS